MGEFSTSPKLKKKRSHSIIRVKGLVHHLKRRMKPCPSLYFKNLGYLYQIHRKISILEGQRILILIWVLASRFSMNQQHQRKRKKLSPCHPHPQPQHTHKIIMMQQSGCSRLSKKSNLEKWKSLRNKKILQMMLSFHNLQSVKHQKELILTTRWLRNMRGLVN